MGFQPRARTPRDLGRRPGRGRSQTKPGKRRPGSGYRVEDEHVATSEEVVERSLNSLTRLGSQRFAISPFYEHYDRWLLSLRTVLSEFGASPAITIDDPFKEECSKVLSDIEQTLKDRRAKETSHEEMARRLNRSLLDARSLLAQTEREHSIKMKEIAGRKERAIKPVMSNLGKLREELNRIVRIRAGFLRGISKKAKARKSEEATQKLAFTKRELSRIEESFVAEQEKLQNEYRRRRQEILKQIAGYDREIANLGQGAEMDDGVDARRAACEALISAVKALLQRNQATPRTQQAFMTPP
jgi:hypothetical protein